jgi:hypothetical protein
MSWENQLTPSQVRDLALRRRVRPARNYHADAHFIRWSDIVFALETCYGVGRDERRPEGRSFVAFGFVSRTHRLRIDFDVGADEEGQVLLVVTAFRSD